MDPETHRTRWMALSPLGLVLIGLGVSVTGHATLRKHDGRKGWVSCGTLGLALLNAGVAVFGEAVKERALYEWSQESRLARLPVGKR
ncbi:MAG TPA: hypothetical protein VGD78_17775 [Chthoniobacterales bacterium]